MAEALWQLVEDPRVREAIRRLEERVAKLEQQVKK